MFNPILASKNIKEEYISYISTSFSFNDERLKNQFIAELNKIVSSGPWLETNDVFKNGKTINQLINENVLSPLFRNLEEKKPNTNLYKKCLPLDRPLYLHQENAIRTIGNGNNVVVSTGTGSGKTNCFLIPVINELLKEKENGTLGPGVRALFIYPMNALANDQMKNIRKILMCYPDITFGVYNGGTENNEDDAISVYEAMFSSEPVPELRHRLENELLSREEMKKNPPNILITNYAMLEHLLFRPNDDVLFSESDFKFVVLDEAHVYAGATGIETSILLSRLRARITSTKGTQFILTSATLGNSSDCDNDIIKFATNLCGVEFKKENIIRAIREKRIPLRNASSYSPILIRELADEKNIISEVFKKYGISYDSTLSENELIYDFVYSSDLYHTLRANIDKVTSLDFIQELLNLDSETTIAFISLCTRAQKNGHSLIDARYHFLIRSLEGCFIALNKDRHLSLIRQKFYHSKDSQYAMFEIALCNNCGKFAIVGKQKGNYLVQANQFDEEIDYFFFAEEENNEIESEYEEETGLEHYYLCPHCGAIFSEIKDDSCQCGSEEYVKIVKFATRKNDKKVITKCGNCHTGNYKRFYLDNDAATAVLATALYEELPELIYEEEHEEEKQITNIFAKAALNKTKKEKKKGRQFLVFSDSRQEAAKFASYLSENYKEFLRRRGICQVIEEQKRNILSNVVTISEFVQMLSTYFSNKRSFADSYIDKSNLTIISNKHAWVAMLNELRRFRSTTSLTSLGVLQFKYLGNSRDIIEIIAKEYKVSEESVQNLLDLLLFEIIKVGAVCSDKDTDIDDNDRKYIFYSYLQRFVSKHQPPNNKKSTTSNWLPRSKNGNKNEFYRTNKLYYVMHFLNVDQVKAVEFLDQYFDYLTKPEFGNSYCLMDKNKDGTYVLPAKFIQVRIPGDAETKWYRCTKCGKISQFHMNGLCTTVRCSGKVEEINPSILNKENHFAKLYFSDRMSPLFIKEHTAQLSKKRSATYQEQFIKKEINALSCSTTFEMGVDVGDLETVFLRNIPPLPSNYAQRAGRTGRSVNAAAYALTFAKLSSHDLSFFKEPQKMINGVILPPLFKIDNEKIVRRHIYAVALSMYFSEHPEQYNHNDGQKFINDKGYEKFIAWLNNKPNRLKDMLLRSIPNIDNLHTRLGLESFSWLEEFCGKEGTFTILIREYENNINEFNLLITHFQKENDLQNAYKCQRKLNKYKSNKLIEFLARGNILPRYGFPVDVVELEQNSTDSTEKNLSLTRDLQIAIAEYAPSSEVFADGNVYTSRYIKKSNFENNKKEWDTAYIGICKSKDCQAVNYSLTPIVDDYIECCSCGEKISKFDFFESIEPRNGFIAESFVKKVDILTKPEKNYKSQDFYVGNLESKTIDKCNFKFGETTITIESTTNDSLMVKSTTNFYVCPKCGFAYAEDEIIPSDLKANKLVKNKAHKIVTETKHDSILGPYKCDCQELFRYSLHHKFNTDVAKISFDCDTSNYETMVSVMYALLYAISDELNIERRDIKACLSLKIINMRREYSIIIYDAVPGGAGHSRRLVTSGGNTLYKIINKALKKMQECNCDPSCYNCLRSYENQKIHDALDRKLAAKFLSKLIDDNENH